MKTKPNEKGGTGVWPGVGSSRPMAVRPDEVDSLDVYFSFFNPEKKE